MSWTRGCLAALAVCALLGSVAGCGDGEAQERGTGVSASPVGNLLDATDERGRHYREIDETGAPEIGIEVQPDADGGWDIRLTVRGFRFSPAGVKPVAVAGRGTAVLSLDGRVLTRLRTTEYHLPGRLVPRGTHRLTARLYADDHTVWAVDGEPVESTADITESEPEPTPAASRSGSVRGATVSGGAPPARTEGRTRTGRSSHSARKAS
ncbi:nuclear transport factor 2 family protein [Streptomyces phyllanthi]|uniref:Nuclear transport factor 2 family protein n=1 Tax=Streptomyces phyllanthi TaxID=1803180 RepID=A0A5N8WBM1_9ACTN|nr:nuclear transport factor 2 family protein [Streptomyces phyllanthi]MPY43525.1 nuclear transport factor 2 family protein [Streptomyces phyllanthi]